MPNSKKRSISVVAGNYTFVFSAQKTIVTPKFGKIKSEEKLRAIARAYKEYRQVMKLPGRPREGEWRCCMNPECRNVFYTPRSKIEQGKGSYCSHSCGAKVFGFKKRKKIA